MVNVLELRNYLLKPGTLPAFHRYFNTHFVEPMAVLGGHTLGQFSTEDTADRFVWLRGFANMDQRMQFLNDFYCDSDTWKNFGPGANNMMINSDNVYLLRPLFPGKILPAITGKYMVIDFYTCNSTREQVVDLFNEAWMPLLASNNIYPSLWISEMEENKFPRLPVFQDKNLLVSFTSFYDKKEYEAAYAHCSIPPALHDAMQSLITTQSRLLLNSL